jgi:hypothetical protein
MHSQQEHQYRNLLFHLNTTLHHIVFKLFNTHSKPTSTSVDEGMLQACELACQAVEKGVDTAVDFFLRVFRHIAHQFVTTIDLFLVRGL